MSRTLLGSDPRGSGRVVGAEAAVRDGGTTGPTGGRRWAAGVTSPLLLPPCMLGVPCSLAVPGSGGGLTSLRLLLSPQNTALDKEGQIFGSKLGAEGGRPGLEPKDFAKPHLRFRSYTLANTV